MAYQIWVQRNLYRSPFLNPLPMDMIREYRMIDRRLGDEGILEVFYRRRIKRASESGEWMVCF